MDHPKLEIEMVWMDNLVIEKQVVDVCLFIFGALVTYMCGPQKALCFVSLLSYWIIVVLMTIKRSYMESVLTLREKKI